MSNRGFTGIEFGQDDPFGLQAIEDAFAESYGDNLRSARVVRVGDPTTRQIKATLGVDTDQPGMIWIHEVDASGNVISIRQAENTGAGRLADSELIFGRWIRVRKTANGEETDGTAGRIDSEFMHERPQVDQRIISAEHIQAFLLRPTDTPSMRVIMDNGVGVPAVVDGTAYLVPTQTSTDFTAQVPTTAGKAKAVLVELDPLPVADVNTNVLIFTLYYTYGSEFNFNAAEPPTHRQTFASYPASVNSARRLLGWVRLYTGMTRIVQSDILPGGAFSGGGAGASFDTAVTFAGMPIWYGGDLVSYGG